MFTAQIKQATQIDRIVTAVFQCFPPLISHADVFKLQGIANLIGYALHFAGWHDFKRLAAFIVAMALRVIRNTLPLALRYFMAKVVMSLNVRLVLD
jgi:hypothetical protein